MFGAWFHWSILDPRNVGWLLDGNDIGQNSIGLVAYFRGLSPWPSLHDPLLFAPEGLNVALTDSNPLLAILLRPFAPLLPDAWQYTGLWLLICVALHIGFAYALIRRWAPGATAVWAGTVLLTVMPALLNRQGHVNLCAQWTILWALWVFVDPVRSRSPARWFVVIAVTALIHPYLLVMVSPIWGGAVLRLAGARDWVAAGRLAVVPTIPLLTIPFLLGQIGQPIQFSGGYGSLPFALDGFWNIGHEGFSRLLPSSPASAPPGFEGMAYLGAGTLVLAMAMLIVAATGRLPRRRDPLPLLPWLILPLGGLLLVAIGPRIIWQGEVVTTIALPPWVYVLFDPVRAAGRLAWPAMYAIPLAAIIAACRLRHAGLILAAAAALQLVDLSPMIARERAGTARADHDAAPGRLVSDRKWRELIASADAVVFSPPAFDRDLAVVEGVAWRAVTACRPVPLRNFYASRLPQPLYDRMIADERALARGERQPGDLVILLGDPPPVLAARARRLDNVLYLPPRRPRRPIECPTAR